MIIAAVVPMLWAVTLMLTHSTPGHPERREQWAVPVESKHIKNFYKVDEGIYRSQQPSPEAFAELEGMGVCEILNFRSQNDDNKEAQGTSLILHHIRMNAGTPRTEQLVEALRIIRCRRGPIVIHCWHGSDRTGIVVALYRIMYQGWSKEEAIDELRNGGYGYHPFYKGILEYIEQTDTDKLKAMVEEIPCEEE